MRRWMIFTSLIVALVLLGACDSASPTATPEPAVETTEVSEETTAQDAEETLVDQDTTAPGTAEGTMLPEVNPITVTGDIVAAGSSAVYPLSERMAERFEDEGYSGLITIDSIGSGAGFERFCVNGETDISNASRGIKDSEVESCRAIGREPIELQRMGRHVDEICKISLRLQPEPQLESFHLRAMTHWVQEMVHQALSAFAHRDPNLVRSIPDQDREVDYFYERVNNQVTAQGKRADSWEQSPMFLQVAHYLERFGD